MSKEDTISWCRRWVYDHQSDPGENVNLAHRPEMKDRVAELKQLLHAGFRAALPAGAHPVKRRWL